MLARGAYDKLGIPVEDIPDDVAFRAGMRQRGQLPKLTFKNIPVEFDGINDPPTADWETGGVWDREEPDALVIVGDDDAASVLASVAALEALAGPAGVEILGVDIGKAQRRMQPGGGRKGEGLEHFGYVDGRSQPLFLKEDIDGEEKANWSPVFKPSQFIVKDPAQPNEFSCGSYFVYRKLEQNVLKFKLQEEELAAALGLTGDNEERAGALVVGRFENGTPVIVSGSEIAAAPPNDFNYSGVDEDNPDKTHCPFKSHIRKTNPRGQDEGERSRIMARRGITYGERAYRPEGADFRETDRPTGGVGLLFMAYMSDISEQFEFTQAAWAGNVNFENDETGIDGVIGQRDNRPGTRDVKWKDAYAGLEADFDFKTSVRLMGGEYFFAPSISFLQNLAAAAHAMA